MNSFSCIWLDFWFSDGWKDSGAEDFGIVVRSMSLNRCEFGLITFTYLLSKLGSETWILKRSCVSSIK